MPEVRFRALSMVRFPILPELVSFEYRNKSTMLLAAERCLTVTAYSYFCGGQVECNHKISLSPFCIRLHSPQFYPDVRVVK